jgi:phytoene/squalene synthetase
VTTDAWAASTLAAVSGKTRWLLKAACPADRFVQFQRMYAYFRWADDIVDAPGRDPRQVRAFVREQAALLRGRAPSGHPELALCAVLDETPLRPVVERMWEALAFDALRGPEPIAEADLQLQVERIGDAYVEALWWCSGAEGAADEGGRWLARAATGTHYLRDHHLDHELGYCNVPIERVDDWGLDLPDGIGRWVEHRSEQLEAWYAQGFESLAGPTRTKWLLAAYGWRYRRSLREVRAAWR